MRIAHSSPGLKDPGFTPTGVFFMFGFPHSGHRVRNEGMRATNALMRIRVSTRAKLFTNTTMRIETEYPLAVYIGMESPI